MSFILLVKSWIGVVLVREFWVQNHVKVRKSQRRILISSKKPYLNLLLKTITISDSMQFIEVQRVDLTCDIIRKVAPLVLSKL